MGVGGGQTGEDGKTDRKTKQILHIGGICHKKADFPVPVIKN